MNSFIVVTAWLAVTVIAGPANPSARNIYKCAGYCKGSNKLSYEVGTTYTYEYTADTVTSVSGTGKEESRLHLAATVEIHSVSQCDFTMQLSNVRLEDSSPLDPRTRSSIAKHADFSTSLERNGLLFSFQDGVISELCATDGDKPWVLNIKRGILSAFQNSMKDLDTDRKIYETDVTGDCETQYEVMSDGDAYLIVKKTRNLLACAHRLDHFLSLQSTQYNSPSRAQSLPLVKSDHECYQSYRNGLLVLAVCNERHLFRPFSNGESGAVTKVVQNLVHKQTDVNGKPASTGVAITRTTLLFQHTLEESNALSRAQTIVTALEELDAKTTNGVQIDVPRVFSQLVATLRTTSYPTLAKVFSHTKNKHTRKFLLDAMPLVGSSDGLTVMTDLYKNGEISNTEMDSWLTSLTFIKKPTITMLSAVSSLLDGEPRAKAILGISAMVHSYCQWDTACHEKDPVVESVNKMGRILGDGCHVKGREDMERKILALKGIGNAGVLPSSLATVSRCYQSADNPMEVRLAAIGAHRRFPCADRWRTDLLATYSDMRHDSELRIAAYLTVMQCPTPVSLQKIKETLYSEEVNQVASFVWTHLTNIQETSSRWKQSIKDLISSDFLRNKFQTDARKFSRNYEGSTFVDSLNVGATVESNIIFSSQSYLPRSAMLNLTLDLFGESVNIFEIGSRAEGFEQIVEDMFGPGGFFPDKSLKQVLQKARGKLDDNDLENSIDQISETFNAKNKLAKEPQASIYARVFGNEIHSSRYQGLEEMLGGYPHIKNPLELLSKLFGGQDIDYTNSFVFIDAAYKIPTIAGLPLNFAVNGTATVGLKMNGHVDLRDLWRKNSLEIEGRIMPSAAVEITGTMSVDAFVTKAGIRTVSTMHTNTYLDGKGTLQAGSLIDVKLNVPREKVEVLEVTSRIFVLHREEAFEVAGILEDKEDISKCSSDTLDKVTGMKLCGELSYPNASLINDAPYFPLTGPVTFRINLIKTDVFDSYELKFQQEIEKSSSKRSLKLHFDTPNSHINRKIVGFLSLNDQDGTALIGRLETPMVKLEMSGQLDYNERTKSVNVVFRMNDEDMIRTQVGLITSRDGQRNRYEPSMELFVLNSLNMALKGKINYVEGTKYTADLTLSGLTDEPLAFSADVNSEGNKYEMIGLIKSPLVEGSLHANLRQTNSYVSTKVTIEYAVRQAKSQSINFAAKIQANDKGDLFKSSAYGSLQMSAAPEYNVLIGWDLMSSYNYFEQTARIGLGPTEWQTKQLYRFHVRGNDVIVALSCQLACPSKDVDYQVDMQYKTTDTSIKTRALAQLTAEHRFLSTFNYVRTESRREMSAELACPWYSATVKGEVAETKPNYYVTKMDGHYTVVEHTGSPRTRSLVLESVYIDGSTETHQDHKLDAEIRGEWNAVFSSGLVASLQKSNQWAELSVDKKKYRADVTYTKNNQHVIEATVQLVGRRYHGKVILLNSDIEKSLRVDLQLSKRLSLTAKAFNDGDNQGIEFELFWDKDVDPTKRIALIAHANYKKQEALLQFPGQYIKGEVDTLSNGISAMLEWAEDQKITVNVEWDSNDDRTTAMAVLKTPFPGLESQSLSASYKFNATYIQTEGNLAWQEETIVFDLIGDILGSDSAVMRAEANLKSSIPAIADIAVTLQHANRRGFKHCLSVIEYNKEKIVDALWRSESSVTIASFNFTSPVKILPSVNTQMIAGSKTLTIRLKYGIDKRVVLELVNDNSSISGLFQAATPYSGLKNTTAKFTYVNNAIELKLTADIEHNNKLTSLALTGSKTDNIILGSGILVTPFMAPFEAGFTHSTEHGVVKEGVSVALDGKQIVLLSLVGKVQSLGNLVLTTDMTMMSNTIVGTIENRLGSTSLESLFEGSWNEHRHSASVRVQFSSHGVHLIGAASSSALSQELKVIFVNKREPGMCTTSVRLPGNVALSHKLIYSDTMNWENTVEIKTPSKTGSISNKQNANYNTLEFGHKMMVGLNGSQATVDVNYKLNGRYHVVEKAEGVLVSPWTHPININFQLPINETTFQPKIKLQYHNNKEITVESFIQYNRLQSKFDLEVKSPFCKPITVKAYYDVSGRTKAALMTVRWEDKQMDLKSTVHLEVVTAMGVLVATRSDIEGQIINAQFKYDVSNKNDMNGHLGMMYKNEKIDIDLSGGLSDKTWKAKCDLETPFKNWEKLTALFNVDISKPTKMAILSVARNLENLSLSGSALLSDISKLSIAFTSSIPSVNSFSLYTSVDESVASRHLIDITWDYIGYRTELLAKLNLEEQGLAEVTIRTPAEGFEILFGQVRYQLSVDTKKSWGIIFMKNDLKVELESSCLFEENGNGKVDVNFRSPFKGLEAVSASLEHNFSSTSVSSTKTNIAVRRNLELVEFTVAFHPSYDTFIANIEMKTPVVGYEKLGADFTINVNGDNAADLVLYKNEKHLKATVKVIINSFMNIEANAQIVTPFENIETISAGFAYNILANQVKADELKYEKSANIYLELPDGRNEIELIYQFFPSLKKSAITSTLELPLFDIGNIKLEGDFTAQTEEQSLNLQVNMDDEFVVVHVEVVPDSVVGSLLTSIKGYEKMTVTSSFVVDPETSLMSSGLLSFDNSDSQIVMKLTTAFNPQATEINLEIVTPIHKWETLGFNAQYDLTKAKKSARLALSKLDAKYETIVDWLLTSNMADCNVGINIPIQGFEAMKMNANYNVAKSLSAKLLLQLNVNRVEVNVFASDKEVKLVLETPSKEFKTLGLTGRYEDGIGTKKLIAQLNKNNMKYNLDLTLNTNKDVTTIILNSPFESWRTLAISLRLGGLRTDKTMSISVVKNSESHLEMSGKIDVDSESRIGFNFNLTSSLLPHSYERLSIGAQSNSERHEKSMMFYFRRNSVTVIEVHSNLLHQQDGGLTYIFELAGEFPSFSKNLLLFEYDPKDFSVKSVNNVTFNGQVDTYSAEIMLTNVTTKLSMLSPIEGYEHFILHVQRNEEMSSIDFSTTFLYFDLLKMSSKIYFKSNDESFISLLMSKGEEFIGAECTLQLDTLYAKTSLAVISPFSQYKNIRLNLECDLIGKSKGAVIAWQNNNVTFKMESILVIKSLLQAETSLNISSSVFENIKFYGSYDLNESAHKDIVIIGHWNDDWQVDIKFNLDNTSSKAHISLNSITPYAASTVSVTGSYNFEDPSKIRSIEGAVHVLNVATAFSVYVENNSKLGRLFGSLSKDGNTSDIKLSWNLENEIKSKGALLILDLGKGMKTEASVTVNLDGLHNAQTVFNFVSFSSHSYSFTADWNVSKYNIKSKFGYQWDEDQEIILESDLLLKSSTSAHIKFTSPFINFKAIDFQSKCSFENGAVDFDTSLQINEDRRIVLNISFSKIKLLLNFVAPNTEPIYFILNRSYTRSKTSSQLNTIVALVDSSFSYGTWKNEFMFLLNVNDIGNTIVDATLKTPVKGITFLQVKSEWNVVTKEAYLILQKENEKFKLSSSLTTANLKNNFNMVLSTPIENSEDWELNSSWDLSSGTYDIVFLKNQVKLLFTDLKVSSNDISLRIEALSRTLNIQYKANLVGPVYLVHLSGGLDDDKAELQINLDTKGSKVVLTEIHFKSSRTKDLILSGSYDHKTSHNVRLTVQNGDQTTEMLGTLRYVTENSKLDVELDSSIQGVGSLAIKTGYNWQEEVKKVNLNVVFGESTFHARFEGKANRNGLGGDLHIDTPIKRFKLIEVKFQDESSNFFSRVGSLNLRFNDDVHQLRYTTAFNANAIGVLLILATPYSEIKQVVINIKHERNFVFINMGVDEKSLDFEGSYQLEDPKSFLKIRLNAPFIKSLEHIEAAFDLDVNDLLFLFMMQWAETDKVNFALGFGPTERPMREFIVRLQTPFEGVKSLQMTTQITTENDSYNINSKATWNDLEIDLDGNIRLEPFDLDISSQAAWENNQLASGRVSLSSNKDKTSGHIVATVQSEEINIAGEVDTTNMLNIIAKLNIQIPFFDIVPITAVAHLKLEDWMEVQVQVALPHTTYSVQASYVLVDNNLKIGLDVDVPVIRTNLALGGSFNNKNWTEVDCNLFANKNKVVVSYKFDNNVLTGSFDLNAQTIGIADARIDIQASTEFNPDVHCSVTYRCGKHFGTLSTFLLKSNGAFSTRLDLDLPSLLGPLVHTARFSAAYVAPQYFAEARYDNGRVTRSASLEVDHRAGLSVIGRANGPSIGEQEVTLALGEKWEDLRVNVINVLLIEAKHVAKSGSIAVEFGGQEHKILYQLSQKSNRLHASLHMESPALEVKKITYEVLFENKDGDTQVEMKCVSGVSTNKVFVQLKSKTSNKIVVLEVIKASEQIIRLDVSTVFNHVNIQSDATLRWFEKVTMASLRHSRSWPVAVELKVTSPYVPQSMLEAKLNVTNTSILVYGSIGEKGLEKYVSLSAKIDPSEKIASFEFLAPSLDIVNTMKFNVVFKIYEEMFSLVSFDGYFLSATLTDSQVSLEFLLSNAGVDTSLMIVTPFIDGKLFKAAIHIPFVLDNNFDLTLSINLPKGINYAFEAKFQSLPEHLDVGVLLECKNTKVGAAMKLEYKPVPALEITLNTPLPMLKNYRLQLKGQTSLADGDDIVNYIEWNDRRVELRHSTIAVPKKIVYRVQLTTPFENYDRFVAGVEYDFTVHKKALVTLGFPKLAEDWIIEFDYRFNTPSDLSFMTLVQAPIFSGFKVASFMIGNRFDLVTRTYRGVLIGRYNEKDVSLTLDGAIKERGIKAEVNAQLNEKKVHLYLESTIREDYTTNSMVELVTPFKFIENAKVSVRISPEDAQKVQANVIFNSVELIDLSLNCNEHNIRTIQLRNPWRPVSASYSFYFEEDVVIIGDVCWDMNNKKTSQFGGGFSLSNGPNGKQDISVIVKLPTRDMSLNNTRWSSASGVEYSTAISWDVEQTLGYKVIFERKSDNKWNSLLRLDFPFRAFEVSSHADLATENLVDVGVKIMWDAASDRHKKMGFTLMCSFDNVEITLQHSGLKHNIAARLEHENWKSPVADQPRIAKLILEYSPLVEDLLVIGTYFTEASEGDAGFETVFQIRHDSTNLNLQTALKISHVLEQSIGDIGVSYIDSAGQKRTLQLYGMISHLYPSIEIVVQTSENSLDLSGSLWSKENGNRGLTVQLSMNKKEPLIVEGRFDVDEMNTELEIVYGSSRKYLFSAGMPTSRHISASVVHSLYGTPSVDGRLTLRLNTSRLLWTQVRWHLGMFDEMERALLEEYSDVSIVAQNIVVSFIEFLDEDFVQQIQVVYNGVSDSFMDIESYIDREMKMIAEDFTEIGELFDEMYERNDFYLKDINQFIKSSVVYAQEKASCLMKQGLEMTGATYATVKNYFLIVADTLSVDFTQISVVLNELKNVSRIAFQQTSQFFGDLKRVSNSVRKSLKSILVATREAIVQTEELFDQLLAGVEEYSSQLASRGTKALYPYVAAAQQYTVLMHNSFQAIERSINELVVTVYNTVMSVKELKELADVYDKYSSWLEEFKIQKYVDDVAQYLNVIGGILLEDFHRMFQDHKEYIDAASSLMSDQMKRVDQVPLVAYCKHAVSTGYQKLLWFWRYHALSDKLLNGLHLALENADDLALRLLKYVDVDDESEPHLNSNIIIRPGLVELSQHLPVDWDNFLELPKYSQLTSVDRPTPVSLDGITKYHSYLSSAATRLTPVLGDVTLLPPFGSSGLLVGKQHFITFDNKFYDFEGECSYLLASDFVDNRFSVIVNYNIEDGKVAKKTLTVLSESHQIIIGTNYRVTVDGIKTEFPATVGNSITVIRDGHSIVIESDNKMSIECNLYHDICTVKLSGWYYGKTGGLLGTFDNEPSNDFSLPDGSSTTNLKSFAAGWRVGSNGRCRPVSNVSTTPINSEQLSTKKCDAYFADARSSLAPCFALVDPKPFYGMCVSDVAVLGTDRALCAANIAYTLQCAKTGVQVQIPQDCVRCELPNNPTMNAGESKVVDGSNPTSADVVFVVDQADCLKNVDFGKLVSRLDTAMLKRGLTDNRFSVVGFGDETLPPLTRTSKGNIWSNARGVEKAFQGLVFNGVSEDEEERDVYDALLIASRLPFRGGVSKTIVLVQCSACGDSLDVGEIMSVLIEQDITLHLLEPRAVQLRGLTAQAKVFGADLSGIYTSRNVKNISPSFGMLKEMVIPKDQCSPLAFETNGTVFNLDRMTENKKQTVNVKKFVDVWARRVAQTAIPSKCQKCDCTIDKDGVGKIQCTRCVTPAVDQLLLDWQTLLTEDYGRLEFQTTKYVDELV